MENDAKSLDLKEPFRYQESWSIPQAMDELSRALRNGTDIAISTSGSSGAPKEILLPASALIFSSRNSNHFLGAKSGERWSLLLSPTHAAGINVLVRSIELGTTPVTVEQSADYSAIVPTQLFRALNGDQQLLQHLQSCKAVLVGGAASDENLLAEAKAKGINCITTYGMTETSGGCVYDGVALPGVEIKIAETIQIKGPMLAKVVTQEGFFVTKDLGYLKDGKLFITGRVDDVIISGGINISLSAVETFLGNSYAAFGREDAEWGVALNLATSGQDADEEIQKRLAEKFGVKARNIYRIKEIPRTALQKVDRIELGKLLPR
ncbi:MAG: AMP-binding protein [Candidatus Nanopelagicaceae bacterium]